jgi:hypothetical protein
MDLQGAVSARHKIVLEREVIDAKKAKMVWHLSTPKLLAEPNNPAP